MHDASQLLLSAFDGHDVGAVRDALAAGADACSPVHGKPPIYWLLEEYHRTDRLVECLQLLFDHGATLDDEMLGSVLLDDEDATREMASRDSSFLTHRTSLVSAFTSLVDVTLLHVAAEYGHRNATQVLIELGADVNARAGIDENGIGGHTPIFHTVNSNRNRSRPIMDMLIEAAADCTLKLDGVYWGRGYEWETLFFDVTPISYAQLGLMPQVHRNERDIYSNIEALLRNSSRQVPPLENVPNRYLQPKAR